MNKIMTQLQQEKVEWVENFFGIPQTFTYFEGDLINDDFVNHLITLHKKGYNLINGDEKNKNI